MFIVQQKKRRTHNNGYVKMYLSTKTEKKSGSSSRIKGIK